MLFIKCRPLNENKEIILRYIDIFFVVLKRYYNGGTDKLKIILLRWLNIISIISNNKSLGFSIGSNKQTVIKILEKDILVFIFSNFNS